MRTIRFYSDSGVVPPAGRTEVGDRLYGAEALDAQIRVLRMQRAVLAAVVRRGSDPTEMQTMHRLARLSDDEQRRIVAEFLDEAFAGLDIEPGLEARMRSAQPELPDDPSPEQIEAAVALAELLEDDGFRRTIRSLSERHATKRAADTPATDWDAAAALVAEKGEGARAAGIDPATPEAAAILDTIVPAFARPGDEPADPARRSALADRIAAGTDARAER